MEDKSKSAVLIIGGCGNLGQALVVTFKQHKFKVVTIDSIECPNADKTIIVKGDQKI